MTFLCKIIIKILWLISRKKREAGRNPLLFFNVVDICLFFFFLFFFLGLHVQHMEVPRIGVKSELQLLACNTATAAMDLSYICDLHHSSRQRQILNPMSDARYQTHILIDTMSGSLPAEPD